MIDWKQLEPLLRDNYIRVTKHPFRDLFILNYTRKASIEGVWNELTLNCRGLIVNKEREVIAKPFTRFPVLQPDTYEQDESIGAITEKLDGTLIILYWQDDKPYLCTKGSFDSFQALIASKIFSEKYAAVVDRLDRSCTYLFELISPRTQSVIDYGQVDDLFLIGIVNNLTWQEADEPIIDLPFGKPASFTDRMIKDIAGMHHAGSEGIVFNVKGQRVKYKYPEYQSSFLKHQEYKKIIFKGIAAREKPESTVSRLPAGNFHKALYRKGVDLYEYLYYAFGLVKQVSDKQVFNYFYQMFSHRVAIKLTKLTLNFRRNKKDDSMLLIVFRDLFFTGQYYSNADPHEIEFFK